LRAVVVGAGIAGLVVARQLGLAGWSVDVVERSAGPRADGYMMDFFGPGVAAAERIGLLPRLMAVSYRVDAAEYVDAAGRGTSRLDYARFSRLAGGRLLNLMRPDMELSVLEALEDVPPGRVRVRYGATVTHAAAEDGGARVALEDGSGSAGEELGADVVIGADGIHSAVRAGLFGAEREYLRPLGMRAAAFVVDAPDLHARNRNRFVLTDTIGRTAGYYGLRTGQVACFLVYRDPGGGTGGPVGDARERLRSRFSGLGDAVDRLLELCPDHPYDDVVAQIVLPAWRRGRAVLVGDACGAVSLLAGQGGSLAIAGAALLGDLLGPIPSRDAVPGALAAFEDRWRPAVEAAQASGRRAAASFLPANRRALLLRRWVLRAAGVPGIDRLVARQLVGRVAK
jgi:2-polyprenyl-6-methoxyphenol hydroxylase-like FAD-dependent oxidoreductase